MKTYGIDGKLIKLLKNYLKDRQQRVFLNGQTISWKKVLADVPKGSVLGPLSFLIYINNLPDRLTSICKIFADDTSLFSKVINKKKSEIEPNKDLKLISQWAYQWKMLFNPDHTKETIVVCFSHKRGNVPHEPLTFNNNKIQYAPAQKHLGLVLDSKLDFNQHIDEKINKCNKIIGTMRRLLMTLSRKSLLTIYKSLVRPLIDYVDIIYDKPCNESFKEKLEAVQYNACFSITGAIRGTSCERLYCELGLETLNNRRCSRKLFFFYKIIKGFSPSYLQKILCFRNVQHYHTRSKLTNIIEQIKARTKAFENSLFPYWLKPSDEIRSIESSKQFKKTTLDFIRLKENSIYAIHDISGLTLLTRL